MGAYGSSEHLVDPKNMQYKGQCCPHCGAVKSSTSNEKRCWVCKKRYKQGLYIIKSTLTCVGIIFIAFFIYRQIIDENYAVANQYYKEIEQAVSMGIVPIFMQNDVQMNITRAEFAIISVAMYETITNKEIAGRVVFTDTDNINVQKVAYIGIMGGIGNDMFAPNVLLTREQVAVIISRFATVVGEPLPHGSSSFADNEQISPWAVQYVGQVQSAGIMGGVGSNMFNPQGNITREQAIIAMMRIFNYLDIVEV